MTPLSFFPVYDMAASLRSKRLRFWLPLKQLFPDLISSSYVVHDKVSISSFYAMEIVQHNLRSQLGMNPDVTLFMDSGGYQIMTHHFSGKPNHVLEILGYQEDNGANIGVTLDFPAKMGTNSFSEALRRMDITIKYATLALQNRQKTTTKLYAVIPGWDTASVKKAAEVLTRYEFDGYALGAPEPVGNYSMSTSNYLFNLGQTIHGVKQVIGSKPLHILGPSSLPVIYVLAGCGATSFDSLRYLHTAKFRDYIMPNGLIAQIGLRRRDKRLLTQLPCSCPICCEVNAEFLSKDGSIQGALIALHNLMVIKNHVKMINSAISEGWWKDLLNQGMKNFPGISLVTKKLLFDIQPSAA